MNNKEKFKIERDSLGEIKVPVNKYWGAQTQRSIENFKIGTELIPIELIHSFAIQKKASAISNLALEKLDPQKGQVIIQVCDEIIKGSLDNHFPLSVWQTGSGTQTNMNLNEVIANRANEILKLDSNDENKIHPNDHCNLSQSSNDSFPTAMNISIVFGIQRKLIPAIDKITKILYKKEKQFSKIAKIGRTHLQDAVPLTLGQEFSAFKEQIINSKKRIQHSINELYFLAQGATAVGTGLNSSKSFVKGFIKAIQSLTKIPFKPAKNKFEAIASHDSIINISGSINTLVTTCYKMSNDIRMLSSGPRSGIGEIILPSNEPGSSIMPGKINPTQCELMCQVCIYLMGCHFSLTIAGSQGQYQLNANKTLIIHNILKIINLLSDSIVSFSDKCLIDITANKKKIGENLNNSLMLITALNPKIGYDKSALIAKKAFDEDITLKESAKKLGFVKEEEFDKLINPIKMTKNN